MNWTDRSRIESYQVCPRLRWWGYEWGRTDEEIGGLEPELARLELEIGSGVHAGVAALLTYAKRHGLTDPVIEDAVALGTAAFAVETARGIALPQSLTPEAVEFKRREGAAMVEGMVWLAGLRIVPAILERFEVLEVEREGWASLTPEIRFAYRPDALLRERETGDLYIWSLKTASEMYEAEFKRSMQGLSEVWAREQDNLEHDHDFVDTPKRIMGVQMCYLLKGRKYEDKVRGCKVHYSPLTRAFLRDDGLSHEWAWSYDVPKLNFKTGEEYIGKLGANFKATPTWEYRGGVSEWVKALHRGEIQPECGDPFAKVWATPEPYFRSDLETVSWLRQVRVQEEAIVDNAAEVLQLEGLEREVALDELFPQEAKWTRGCYLYPGVECEMVPICLTPCDDPLSRGFRRRRANHPQEAGG